MIPEFSESASAVGISPSDLQLRRHEGSHLLMAFGVSSETIIEQSRNLDYPFDTLESVFRFMAMTNNLLFEKCTIAYGPKQLHHWVPFVIYLRVIGQFLEMKLRSHYGPAFLDNWMTDDHTEPF